MNISEEGRLSSRELRYRTEDDELWLVNKPYKHNDSWLVWPETLFTKMDITDCNDTIDGVCLTNKSLSECIDECNEDCGAGLYFEIPNDKSICVPIRTAIHPTLNPIYRLRRQKYYDGLGDIKVHTFVNTNKFTNPPNQGNATRYYDIVTLLNPSSKKIITAQYTAGGNNIIHMTTNPIGNIQFIPIIYTAGEMEQDFPILYGDKLNIVIPGTNLTMTTSKKGILEWRVIPIDQIKISDMYYSFLPGPGNSANIGDIVTNQIPLILTYGSDHIVVSINHNNNLMLYDKTVDEVRRMSDVTTIFSVISKMVGYYCEEEECRQIPISDITPDTGAMGKYKDRGGNWKPIYRHKGCWDNCRTTSIPHTSTLLGPGPGPGPGPKRPVLWWVYLILSLAVVLVLVLVLVTRFL